VPLAIEGQARAEVPDRAVGLGDEDVGEPTSWSFSNVARATAVVVFPLSPIGFE
jgi:hypothetical protein